MATGTGIDAQVGYVAESAYGTGVTVTRFLPVITESMAKEIEWVESDGQYTGAQVRRSVQQSQGNATVGGDIGHEFYTQSSVLLLRVALGTVNTVTAGGTSVHTLWPTTPSVSASVQVGRPTVYGSVIPFTYTGAMISSFEIAATQGANVTWGATWVAQEETMGTALASASYSTSMRPWRFQECSLTIDGTVTPVKSFKLNGEMALDVDRRFLGGTTISQPLRNDLAVFSGEIECEWGNPSTMGTMNYHRFLGGTMSAFVFTMVKQGGTETGTITANVRYDGATPASDGRGIVQHTIPFTCIAAGTLDNGAVSFVIQNNDSTA